MRVAFAPGDELVERLADQGLVQLGQLARHQRWTLAAERDREFGQGRGEAMR